MEFLYVLMLQLAKLVDKSWIAPLSVQESRALIAKQKQGWIQNQTTD